LVPEPDRAAREIRRILRPGGRLAVAVWGPRERNPWLGIVFDAVGARLGAPVPPPGVPGPFSLDDPDRLARLLSGAGLADVHVGELPTPLRARSLGVVDEDVCSRRASGEQGRIAARRGRAGASHARAGGDPPV